MRILALVKPTDPVAAHAADIRACSLYAYIPGWLDLAESQGRGDSPEAKVAQTVHAVLYELMKGLEPKIERLARVEAAKETCTTADTSICQHGLFVDDLMRVLETRDIEAMLADRGLEPGL